VDMDKTLYLFILESSCQELAQDDSRSKKIAGGGDRHNGKRPNEVYMNMRPCFVFNISNSIQFTIFRVA